MIIGKKNKESRSAIKKAKRTSGAKSTRSYRPVVPTPPRVRSASKAINADPTYTIDITGPIRPHPYLKRIAEENKRPILYENPIDQIVGSIRTDEREVNIGLDFGTSSVKVVIGDNGLNKAFAVPFYETTGLSAFLLPSSVWKKSDGYTLRKGDQVFRWLC